jgi:hypothetical protein
MRYPDDTEFIIKKNMNTKYVASNVGTKLFH